MHCGPDKLLAVRVLDAAANNTDTSTVTKIHMQPLDVE